MSESDKRSQPLIREEMQGIAHVQISKWYEIHSELEIKGAFPHLGKYKVLNKIY